MYLQHINISAQSLDTLLNSIKDMLPRQPHAIHKLALIPPRGRNRRLSARVVDAKVALGEDHDAVARDVVLAQRLAEDFLGYPVAVDVGCVPGVDAAVVSVFDEWERSGFVQHPVLPGGGAVGHAAEDYFGDFEAGFAEAVVFVKFLFLRFLYWGLVVVVVMGDVLDVFHFGVAVFTSSVVFVNTI